MSFERFFVDLQYEFIDISLLISLSGSHTRPDVAAERAESARTANGSLRSQAAKGCCVSLIIAILSIIRFFTNHCTIGLYIHYHIGSPSGQDDSCDHLTDDGLLHTSSAFQETSPLDTGWDSEADIIMLNDAIIMLNDASIPVMQSSRFAHATAQRSQSSHEVPHSETIHDDTYYYDHDVNILNDSRVGSSFVSAPRRSSVPDVKKEEE